MFNRVRRSIYVAPSDGGACPVADPHAPADRAGGGTGHGSQDPTLAEIEAGHVRRYRLITSGLIAAGLAALCLSAIGLYAVVAFSVGQCTREIAVRMAVGARGQQVVTRFVSDGLHLSVIGLALGLPVSLVGLRFLMANLASDIPRVPLPWVTAIAAAGVVLVAATAAWLSARRAATVDPAVTLRSE